MNRFRAPFFWLGYFAFLLAVLVELGSAALLDAAPAAGVAASAPGWGIRTLALVDAIALFGITLVGIAWTPKLSGIAARFQGIAALVLSLGGCVAGIAVAYAALTLLTLMVTLLLAVPFGTIAYFTVWSRFPVGAAQTTLALVMFLKLAFCVLLVLAQKDFLKNKGLVATASVSIGATWLTALLIGFVPRPFASITDVIAALVLAIIAIVWLVILLIAALFQLIATVRSAPP